MWTMLLADYWKVNEMVALLTAPCKGCVHEHCDREEERMTWRYEIGVIFSDLGLIISALIHLYVDPTTCVE